MEPQEREVELIDYIEILLKRKWHILAGTLLCVVATSGYLFLKAPDLPLYQASAQIFIVPSQAQAQLKETQVELPTLTPAFYQAVAMADENVLAMNQLQRALIDSLGLTLAQTPLSLEAEVVDNVRMVMRVSAADTLVARRVLYAWVDLFLDQNQALNATESKRYYRDIAAQYEQARENLERVDSAFMALSAKSMFSSVLSQQEQYKKILTAAQDFFVAAEFELKKKEDRLTRLREMMQGLEQDGSPIYTLSAAEREHLEHSLLSPPAQQMLAYVGTLDTLKEALGQARTQYNLSLIEFEREYNLPQLAREVEEVKETMDGYQQSYLLARSQQLTASVKLQAIEEEIKKHRPVVGDVGKAGATPEGGVGSGKVVREINPVYTELEQQQAKEGVTYEMARVYAERGEKELRELLLRLEQVQSSLFAVQQKRQVLVGELTRDTTSIGEQVKFFQDAFDAARRTYLENKKRLSGLELEVALEKGQTEDQKKQLGELEQSVIHLQESMAVELAESERLNREKKTFTATFERFSQLAEEARIAQQKAAHSATNLRLITRDVMARPAGGAERSQKIPTSAALGLLLSTVLVFLVEYIRKARQRRSVGQLRRSGDT